jgi:hypothetical protein
MVIAAKVIPMNKPLNRKILTKEVRPPLSISLSVDLGIIVRVIFGNQISVEMDWNREVMKSRSACCRLGAGMQRPVDSDYTPVACLQGLILPID